MPQSISETHTLRRQYSAELVLVTVTFFWGATFPLVKDAIKEIPVMAFLWMRFTLAAIILLVWAGYPAVRSLEKRGWIRGVILGLLLFAVYAFQTFGLALTSSANTAFVTGLNVVWVPLLAGPILKKPAAPASRLGVSCALIGLFMLTYQTPWQLNIGDALVLICSFFIAFHILGLDAWTHGYDGRALAFVQIGTIAVLSFVSSMLFEPMHLPSVWTPKIYWAVIVCSVFATVYAFWAMTVFQKRTTPTRAALIYSLEPVFGALMAVFYAGERLSAIAWLGGTLIVFGMIIAEALPLVCNKNNVPQNNIS